MALPSLTSQQVRKIEGLIQAWTNKLTWDLLVKRIETDLDIKTTRQTLHTYLSIKTTFQDRKQVLQGGSANARVQLTRQSLDMAFQIEKLQAENAVLTKRVERQMAFINEIAEVAKNTPSVLSVMEALKAKLQRQG